MLKLRFKKEQKVRITVGKEVCDIIVGGYENGKYVLIFNAPMSVKIVHGKMIKEEKKEEVAQ